MQTSLVRRRRQRRMGASRRPRGGGAARNAAIAFPLLLFAILLVIGSAGFVGVVSAYAYYSRDLPDPKARLLGLSFDQQTVVTDRTGTIDLARLGERKREVVTFAEIPDEMLDATTAIEDKDFWSNPGFDLGGFVSATIDTINGRPRGGSTITQQLVRNRLLPPEALDGTVYERKAREIIQSIRLTQEFPGDIGKEQIITAYLNQNFYGNQSYGVRAAAQSYFKKTLDELTLAETAILAAIPQSPTRFDLTRQAVVVCGIELAVEEVCPLAETALVVPPDSEIVVRRNRILDLMKTRSVLSGARHAVDEYERAKKESVILASQAATPWKAPHFVWQVRAQLAEILCPGQPADGCEKVDTGGYRVTSSLDWPAQQIAEKWTYVAARAPHAKKPESILAAAGIPESEWGWIKGLGPTRARPTGANIHNAASAIIDYRTGQVLAYVGSASYTSNGSAKFDPQWDVLSDSWRQPGSAIKPVGYAIGIDDRTMTAATMFMDVVTDFGKGFTPTQADGLERGPVRLRSALQFSLNIPAIKAGLTNGLEHYFNRSRDFGLEYGPRTIPVVSMAIGTLEVHPIDLLGAYGAIADGGVLMPRTIILDVTDSSGNKIWPLETDPPSGERVISAQAAYIVTDILAGNTNPKVNPYWSEWRIVDGKTARPAAYKTGTTSDNRDVHAYGYLAPPEDPTAPALAVGVWMGNSNNEPNKGSLSLDSSAPLWSAILNEVSRGLPIAAFKPPDGLETAAVDAISGLLPGPFTAATVKEIFIKGTVPKRVDNLRITLDVDETSGLLWQDGCAGPMVQRGFLDFSSAEPNFPKWLPFTLEWASRAARGVGVAGGPERTRTTYFYNTRFAPFGKGWGGTFAPTELCQPLPPPQCDAQGNTDPTFPPIVGSFGPEITPEPTPCLTPEPTQEPPPGGPTPTPNLPGPKPKPTPPGAGG
ncbi:MAG: transglycosylase domain-containing protein [Chloroflexota bacterium]